MPPYAGQVADCLLQLKASCELSNAEGNTALMYAAHGGHEELCSKLLEASAPVEKLNRAGLSAEAMAARRGQTNYSK